MRTVLALAALVAAAEVQAQAEPTHLQAGVELLGESFPSGVLPGADDGFVAVIPLLAVEQGPAFQLVLGPTLRLRLVPAAPAKDYSDYFGVLRRQDWDSPSDFGQVVRFLHAGAEDAPIQLIAGRFTHWTLGFGHLITRYDDTQNADYHPASAEVSAFAGRFHFTGFASDLLAARLFALSASVDPGPWLGWAGEVAHLTASVAHDFGRGGGVTPSMTLAQVDLDATLQRSALSQVSGYLGVGGRLDPGVLGVGGLVGFSWDLLLEGWQLGAKLELRRHQAGYRPGLFNGAYELSRFSAVGLAREPLADEKLPNGASAYGELLVTGGTQVRFTGSAAAESFFYGRWDADVMLGLAMALVPLSIDGRLILVGLGEAPRTEARVEGRLRVQPSLYLVALVGTVFLPGANGALTRGVDLGLGAGADFGL